MKVIATGRQRGKTTEMIKLAAAEFLYIVVPTTKRAEQVFHEARGMGLDIPFPLTWHEFAQRRYHPPGTNGFLIDDLDVCVQAMTPLPVKAISVTVDETS